MANGGAAEDAYAYLMSYYATVSPLMAEAMQSDDYKAQSTPEAHVQSVLDNGIYLWIPPNSPADPIESIKLLRNHFPPTHGPVTYDGGHVTNQPVLIGSLYVMLLEKTGVDWSGTSSSKLQHFGIPARVSNVDKYATPGRNQPVRILGEAEIRLLNAVAGSDVSADLLDQSNNPATHKAIIQQLLSSQTPTNFDRIIDRREVPLGNSRNISLSTTSWSVRGCALSVRWTILSDRRIWSASSKNWLWKTGKNKRSLKCRRTARVTSTT